MKKASPARIGAFVIGAIGLTVIAIVLFGSGRMFRETVPFILFSPSSVNGLAVGAPVKFKGVKIGEVTDIKLGFRGIQLEQPQIPILIELDPDRMVRQGGRVDVHDMRAMEDLIENRGLRARLETESIVTGLLYVSLDTHPDTPINRVLPANARPLEIPTIPTAFEQVQTAATQIIAKIEELQIGPLVDNANETLEGLNEIIHSPDLRRAVAGLDETVAEIDKTLASVRQLADNVDRDVGPLLASLRSTSDEAGQTMTQATKTLENLSEVTEPGAPLQHQLNQALEQLTITARAIQNLADYLERNRHPWSAEDTARPANDRTKNRCQGEHPHASTRYRAVRRRPDRLLFGSGTAARSFAILPAFSRRHGFGSTRHGRHLGRARTDQLPHLPLACADRDPRRPEPLGDRRNAALG